MWEVTATSSSGSGASACGIVPSPPSAPFPLVRLEGQPGGPLQGRGQGGVPRREMWRQRRPAARWGRTSPIGAVRTKSPSTVLSVGAQRAPAELGIVQGERQDLASARLRPVDPSVEEARDRQQSCRPLLDGDALPLVAPGPPGRRGRQAQAPRGPANSSTIGSSVGRGFPGAQSIARVGGTRHWLERVSQDVLPVLRHEGNLAPVGPDPETKRESPLLVEGRYDLHFHARQQLDHPSEARLTDQGRVNGTDPGGRGTRSWLDPPPGHGRGRIVAAGSRPRACAARAHGERSGGRAAWGRPRASARRATASADSPS